MPTAIQKIVIHCSLLALMEWTPVAGLAGTVADWDQESRRGNKLADVLCCSVVLKSPGATLGV